jgi:hypothetical protein
MRTKNLFGLTSMLAAMSLSAAWTYDGRVDFSVETGKVRPELHSSGFGPHITNWKIKSAETIKSLGFNAARTHDWALINPGQRVCDTHFIFPLMHLDAKDPRNYYFKPTDELLRRTREMGLKILFRLGTSIEHSGDVFFNAAVPDDFHKYAEVLAGIVRHYTRGWADGFHWDINHWEIWNEPSGCNNMWRLPGEDGKNRELLKRKFFEFYTIVLKRLKSEFPELKFGGPALAGSDEAYITEMLNACRKAGVEPDFMSWHEYQRNLRFVEFAATLRELSDSLGFKKMELYLDEWHYLPYPSAWEDYSGPPARRARVNGGSAGQNNIDSAVFTLSALSRFQSTPLDQAYFYGCGWRSWGYRNGDGTFNKVFYALKAFGRIANDCGTLVKSEGNTDSLTFFGARSKDTKRDYLIACDFGGGRRTIEVDVSGIDSGRRPTVYAIDNANDLNPVSGFAWNGRRLVLTKCDVDSAAFFVVFE